MAEKFGNAIYLVGTLHAFMLFIAVFCIWIGYRVRFLGDLELVRDAKHVPAPNGQAIANPYGNSYLIVGILLVGLAIGTPFGLPFAQSLISSAAVMSVHRIYRGYLLKRAGTE